jgi:hypothetical protein
MCVATCVTWQRLYRRALLKSNKKQEKLKTQILFH